ncbi:MAG: ornithine cyclodeaminase family protein [Acidobacteria bacterium]|nr:ornithine cyclodeaminase family protein [Acidobacteriota bacterium]
MGTFLLLTEADVRRVLTMEELVDCMEGALAQYSTGDVAQPLRSVIVVGSAGFFGVMPAYLPTSPALGTKLVTVFHDNRSKGLPSHLASIVLLDPATGALLAMVDGRYITEARTGAVSAVSARQLASSSEPATLAILGSGVQARSHLEALAAVRRLTVARVWSPNETHRSRFASETTGRFSVEVHPARTAEEAVRDTDLIVVATNAVRPLLMNAWVKPGAHVMAVGACRPDQQELDPELVARARVVVDSRSGALAESGDILMPIRTGRFGEDHIAAELGEVVAGKVRVRQSGHDVTLFKSLGMAVEDVASAHLAYRRAREKGIGRELEL